MNAGTKLDALIAEKVFGIGWCQLMKEGFADKHTGPRKCKCGAVEYPYEHHAPYSTDISAAWEVVEKVDLLSKLSLERFEGKYILVKYLPGYDNDFVIVSESERAPHAICLAVLELQKLVN